MQMTSSTYLGRENDTQFSGTTRDHNIVDVGGDSVVFGSVGRFRVTKIRKMGRGSKLGVITCASSRKCMHVSIMIMVVLYDHVDYIEKCVQRYLHDWMHVICHQQPALRRLCHESRFCHRCWMMMRECKLVCCDKHWKEQNAPYSLRPKARCKSIPYSR
ncbi:hypothetical protein BS17DRAFT_267796 [Gyrodon lividus]|nr:hypothetical protein BS17DRAFT_267796 [Gyrodon lividus]